MIYCTTKDYNEFIEWLYSDRDRAILLAYLMAKARIRTPIAGFKYFYEKESRIKFLKDYRCFIYYINNKSFYKIGRHIGVSRQCASDRVHALENRLYLCISKKWPFKIGIMPAQYHPNYREHILEQELVAPSKALPYD